MKCSLVALLLLMAGVVGAAPLKVGLYADKGCRGAGAALWARILDGSPDAALTLLSGEDLRKGGLAGLDLFVVPLSKDDLGAGRGEEFDRLVEK